MNYRKTIPFPVSDAADRELTVRELVALYLEHEGPTLAEKPLRQRKAHLELFVARFGDHKISQLRPSDLKTWVRNRHEWAADDTKRNVVIGVKRAFSWAFDDQRIANNPFRKVSWPAGKPRRSMTDDEYQRCLRMSRDGWFRRVLVFFAETGCRPQDVCNVTWPMVDFENAVVVIPVHKTAKKTGRPVLRYLTPVALKLLRWLHRQSGRREHVFVNSKGRPWLGPCLDQRMIRLRELAGIDASCKLYGLRHRAGNKSQAAGNDIRTTADLLGHASVRTTERYYLHPEERRKSLLKAAERAARHKDADAKK
jgi:integrase